MENVKKFLSGFLESCGFGSDRLRYGFVDGANDSKLWISYASKDDLTHMIMTEWLSKLNIVEFITSVENFQTQYLKDNE